VIKHTVRAVTSKRVADRSLTFAARFVHVGLKLTEIRAANASERSATHVYDVGQGHTAPVESAISGQESSGVTLQKGPH